MLVMSVIDPKTWPFCDLFYGTTTLTINSIKKTDPCTVYPLHPLILAVVYNDEGDGCWFRQDNLPVPS